VRTLKTNVIIIHGAGPKHYRSLEDGSGDWQANLPYALGDEYKVISPQMPSPKNPSYEEWKILLDKNLAKVRGEVIFVGHSLGGSFLLKYISEERISHKILGLFLVAVPFNTIKGFEAPASYSKFWSLPNVFLYHSTDDVEVPYAHSIMYQDRLHARLKTYTDCGHYFKRSEFRDIASDIKSTVEEVWSSDLFKIN
jgi:predicted alpha/beta hydrolase family esterase